MGVDQANGIGRYTCERCGRCRLEMQMVGVGHRNDTVNQTHNLIQNAEQLGRNIRRVRYRRHAVR